MRARKPFHVMAKPVGPTCNLACSYCYYRGRAELFRGTELRMRPEVLEHFVRSYLDAAVGTEVTFTWQGGEPTLAGLEFFVRAVELQHRFARQGVRVRNAFQTNGVSLDAAWCRFFREHDFLVGVSVDGPASCHDLFRRSKAGESTLARVARSVRLLHEHGVEVNALACVHRGNQHHPLEVYEFLRDELAVRHIQLIAVGASLPGSGAGAVHELVEQSVEPRAWGQFLIATFDAWARSDVGRVFVQPFESALAGWVGAEPGVCIHQEICGRAVLLEHNGDLFACDHFVAQPFRLGNIVDAPLASLVDAPQQRQFGRDKRARLPPRCRGCRFLAACRGGCPKDRIVPEAAGEPPLHYLCEGYVAFFEHVAEPMDRMAEGLRAGQSAAEVMAAASGRPGSTNTRGARPARNDPCPCGSGLKYKHCHGAG